MRLHSFHPDDYRLFVELPYFRRRWLSLELNDDDLRHLQLQLLADPMLGDVVAGTGGLRKCRFASVRSGRGKRGSYRIGYIYFREFDVVALIAIYSKQDQANLTAAERDTIRSLVPTLRSWIATQCDDID